MKLKDDSVIATVSLVDKEKNEDNEVDVDNSEEKKDNEIVDNNEENLIVDNQ